MSKKYDTLVFIGRFSPFHLGHEQVVKEALNQAKNVVILVGSAFHARDIRNPWIFNERKQMIRAAFPNDLNRIFIQPLPDYPYDDNKWLAAAQSLVYSAIPYTPDPIKIGLIGHNKDHTSYYLNMFPKWGSVEVENYLGLNATDIREDLFINWYPDSHKLSDPVVEVINATISHQTKLKFKDWWVKLAEEYELISKYKQAWNTAPYPPTFVTVDSVVVQSGHILLVKRKSAPGMGLWAIPGGFLDKNETLLDGALRELKEETRIKVPIPVLKGSIKDHKTFDDPHRSTRGRTITTAYFIDLGHSEKLPKVTAADDAEKAVWVPFKDVDRTKMFEDHFHIIDYFINIG